jgi:hypothetical protein
VIDAEELAAMSIDAGDIFLQIVEDDDVHIIPAEVQKIPLYLTRKFYRLAVEAPHQIRGVWR